MSQIKIITDSCSDLPDHIIKKYDIKVLPTPVHIGDESFLDGKTLTTNEFYKKLEEGAMPSTSQISPGKYEKIFKEELDKGNQVLTLCFSGELSGIFQSAALAKKNIGSDDIRVIDTRGASIGFGMTVLRVAKALKEGKSFSELIELAIESSAHMEHIFAVGSIEMLKRGGRISGGKALIANVLNIKPILHFEDGEIIPYSKVRGKKKMLQFLIDEMEKSGLALETEMVGINHSASPELADKIQKKIKNKFGTEEFLVGEIGAAIGSHAGPGTVSVFFRGKEKVAEPEVV
ncbi:MAG: DegV family protein [Bacillota bacterium]